MQPPDLSITNSKPSKGPLILIGASIRSAAESANLAGFDLFGIDLFGDVQTRAACRSFCLVDNFLALPTDRFMLRIQEFIAQSVSPAQAAGPHKAPVKVAAVLVGGVQRISEIQNRLSKAGIVLNVPKEAAPDLLAGLAEQSGIQFPPIRRSPQSSQTENSMPKPERANRTTTSHWLVKSTDSSGGLGVRWAYDLPNEIKADEFAQRWIPGRSYGVSFVSDGNRVHLLGVCRSFHKRCQNRPFVYSGSVGPVRLLDDATQRLRSLGKRFATETSFRGIFNADVIIDVSGNIHLLEINPRWSGSSEVIERALRHQTRLTEYDDSLFQLLMDAAAGSTRGMNAFDSHFGYDVPIIMKKIVFARHGGKFRRSKISSSDHYGISEWEITDVPFDESGSGVFVPSGAPIATVVVRSHRQSFEWRKIKRLLAKVQRAVGDCE